MNIIQQIKTSCPWRVKASLARLNRTGIILMYHRINDAQPDPWHLNVVPQYFDEQMRVIKKYGKPVPMRVMGRDLSKINPVNDEIAVTFDDGFADNFHNARPVLEKHEVPATFYVPSQAIESQQEFWWDKLSRIVTALKLPRIFEMSINNTQYRWNVDSDIKEEPMQFELEPPPLNSLLSKRQLYLSVWRIIRPLSFQQQNGLVEKILAWSGQSSRAQSAYLPMSLDELNQMANSKLFEIGAHTVHHPLLSAWPIKEQEEEILAGRKNLEKWTNKKITSFAYPFGDYSNETPGILERSAFQNACTVSEGPVKRNMDRFRLPRFMVFNWNGDQFEEKLREWLTRRT